MGNVLRVLRRDALRLIRTPAALVVVAALLVLPSAYTWYNVAGFWDPYGNTGNLRVCVVNQDEGGESELTGPLDVGDLVVEGLEGNDQLGWDFVSYDEAMAQLESGQCYAAFVIPPDFTSCFLSLLTGDFQRPQLEYYVNEKLGPVSPKITDTGATTLDEAINSAFVANVSDVAAQAIDEKVEGGLEALRGAQSEAASRLAAAMSSVEGAREAIGALSSTAEAALSSVSRAREALGRADAEADALAAELAKVRQRAEELQGELGELSGNVLPEAAAALGSAGDADALALRSELDELGAKAREAAQAAEEAASQVAVAEGDPGTLLARAGSLEEAVREAIEGAREAAERLYGTVMPSLSAALASLSQVGEGLSATAASQQLLVGQASSSLDEVEAVASSAHEALSRTDELLAAVQSDLSSVRDDLLALGGADELSRLFGEGGLDASKVADFMGAPTEVITEQLYPLSSYGAAMAPLFMNLTFWIGAFMLLVIMRQEVDDEGVSGLTLSQRYLSRFLLYAVLVVLQAVICCAGVLVLGVQPVSAPALFLAAVVASLAYLSVTYALSVTLQHVGKGICIVLVFAQIPGATGLYPIEMTAGFFQVVYPLFPFTYGIGAMREALCGFYGSSYAQCLAVLGLFLAAFLALGLLARPLLSNVNRMVATQIRKSGLYNGEDVEVPARPFRLSQILRALADKERYRAELERRSEQLDRAWPRIMRATAAVGVVVPVALWGAFALLGWEKVVLLTLWLLWLMAVFGFLIALESLRFGLRRQMRLDGMSEQRLHALYGNRNAMERPAVEEAEGDE